MEQQQTLKSDCLEQRGNLHAPFQLKINLLREAYGVSKYNMRFFWANIDSGVNCYQTAYRIFIVKRLDDFKKASYIFDSDWIASGKNTSVTIKGLENILEDNELYYWTVRVKSNTGEISPPAVPAPFSTDIGKEWIETSGFWAPIKNELEHCGHFVFFRSPSFDLTSNQVEKVIISASARDVNPLIQQNFDLLVNGKSVGYGPGRPHSHIREVNKQPYTRIFYNSYDVTNYIMDGSNSVAAISTSTIFLKDGYNLIGDKSAGTNKKSMFLAQITVFLKNHTKKILTHTGDGMWKALDGTIAFGNKGRTIGTQYFIMNAEDIDAKSYPFGWAEKDFDDSGWSSLIPVQSFYDPEKEVLCSFPSENTLRIITDEAKKKVEKLPNGDWIIDLGREIIGGLFVRLDSPEDKKIDVFCGEQLNEDGTVRYHMACGPIYHETWLLKKGQQQFHTFTMKCFRYIQIHGFTGTLNKESFTGWALQQPFDETQSSFFSSSDLLNREYDLSKYTIKATNQDIFVDSQARERRPYEGDLLVNGNTSYAVIDQYSLARYSIDYLLDHETWPEDYKLFNVEFAWQDYLYTGDPLLLKKRYPILKEKLLRGENGADNFDERVGLVTGVGLVDWPKNERDGYVEGKYNTPFNSIYAEVYSIMANIAAVVGNRRDQEFYNQRSKIIKRKLLNSLFDQETKTFFDSMNADGTINKHRSLHSSAYALAYSVIAPKDIDSRLIDFVYNNGTFKGSIYFAYFILRGLFNSNAGDKAIRLLLNTDTTKNAKTFVAILDNLDVTITPEAWSNSYKPNLTLSHPWGATPGCMIVQGIFGIRPTSPGFDTFIIKLQPGNIKFASLITPSIKGPIHTDYKQTDNGEIILEVDIPMNTRATVSVPIMNSSYSNNFLSVNGDIIKAVNEDKFLTIELSSGHYRLKHVKTGF